MAAGMAASRKLCRRRVNKLREVARGVARHETRIAIACLMPSPAMSGNIHRSALPVASVVSIQRSLVADSYRRIVIHQLASCGAAMASRLAKRRRRQNQHQ